MNSVFRIPYSESACTDLETPNVLRFLYANKFSAIYSAFKMLKTCSLSKLYWQLRKKSFAECA